MPRQLFAHLSLAPSLDNISTETQLNHFHFQLIGARFLDLLADNIICLLICIAGHLRVQSDGLENRNSIQRFMKLVPDSRCFGRIVRGSPDSKGSGIGSFLKTGFIYRAEFAGLLHLRYIHAVELDEINCSKPECGMICVDCYALAGVFTGLIL